MLDYVKKALYETSNRQLWTQSILKDSHGNTKNIFLNFIIVNLINKGILYTFLLLVAYLWIALRKNLIIDSLVEYFEKNHKNAKCINFDSHNPKFSQEKYFALSGYYRVVCFAAL